MKHTENKFNSNGYWNKPIEKLVFIPTKSDLDLFDQNGYDLTVLEQYFAHSNHTKFVKHREHIRCIKSAWFEQDDKIVGAVLNHSNLFERKGYEGEALDQLKYWSVRLPLVNKIIALRPKWGLDFSMDYVDREGNAFEVLHWEYDSFDVDEIEQIKARTEPILTSIDWDDAGEKILARKSEWHGLDFFGQSDWKCSFFGMPKERFKMVSWV